MNREKPSNEEIYHVYNRGTDKRLIFQEEIDYIRFIHDLFEFNDTADAGKPYIPPSLKKTKQSPEVNLREIEKQPRELLVEILAFCLMPNHFHLLLRQKIDNGIPKFMLKLGTGYTNYFNKKYERGGVLFQGSYKHVQITEQNHFVHLPYYIHLNPLDLITPAWREGILYDLQKILRFLKTYRWSSYLDYVGIKNFPSVTQRALLAETLGTSHEQTTYMIEWIQRNGLETIEHLILESPEG